jgi:lactoylglutathione lyase
MSEGTRVRALGINHVALEVGDVDEALAFYGQVFELTLRGRAGSMAFVDLGDQFVALAAGNGEPPGTHRHFGLVVEDKEAVRARLQELGLGPGGGRNLRLHDPWGNVVEIVDYRDVQYAKRDEVLSAMRAEDPGKRERALEELAGKGVDVGGYRRAP